MTLHAYNPNQYPYQVSTSYILRFLKYSLDKILKVKVTMARSKVKSKLHHNVAHHDKNWINQCSILPIFLASHSFLTVSCYITNVKVIENIVRNLKACPNMILAVS